MAEAAKKIAAVNSSKNTETSSDTERDSSKPKRDWLGMLSLLFVSVNLIAMGSLGFALKKLWSRIYLMEAKIEEVALAQKEEFRPLDQGKLTGRAINPPTTGVLYPLEGFLVNISSEQGPRFLQTQMEFELIDSATEDEVTKKKAAIRDAILVLLSSRSYKEIREPSGMNELRKDIRKAVNQLITGEKIREVYFTQFHFN